MEQENQDRNNYETYLKQKFSTDEWLSFKAQHEDISSKFYLTRDFYEEQRANLKHFRFNRKNHIKVPRYVEQNQLSVPPNTSFDHQKLHDQIYQCSIPNTATYTYEGHGSRIYNCNWTQDGQNLLVTSQHGTTFFNYSDNNQLELAKVIACRDVNWAITDSDISLDNKFMVHSTLSNYVQLFDVENSRYAGRFNLKGITEQEDDELENIMWFFSFRIYSLKISGDNREIIAGCGRTSTGAPVQVFDLERNRVKHSIVAHTDDINSICYVDKEASTLFLTGSDDGVCKLWDSRILENNKPVGIFYGHVSGMTCVTSKEDSRYFISNCKDQSIKLWDMRKSTTEKIQYPFLKYDYRCDILGPDKVEQIKKCQKKCDKSVMTFWGHQVHLTLIRCHFSPVYGTAQRYIYTGSYDGRVYIYDTVSGSNVSCLEPPDTQINMVNSPVIRDCAWHPFSQSLISTSFFGGIYKWEYLDVRDAEKIDRGEVNIQKDTKDCTMENEDDVHGVHGREKKEGENEI